MKTSSSIILALFAIVAIADLIMVAQGMSRYITKPLIMIALMAFYYIASKDKNRFHLLFFIAMVFAWLGDVFLMFDGYFVVGLSSFLIMQLLYAFIFFKQKGDIHAYKILLVLAILAIGILLACNIIPVAGDFQIPVIAYSACITLMGIAATIRKDLVGYWVVFAGIVFFIISDSLLAVNMFDGPIQYGGIGVMLTYILAQFLIVIGYLRVARKLKILPESSGKRMTSLQNKIRE